MIFHLKLLQIQHFHELHQINLGHPVLTGLSWLIEKLRPKKELMYIKIDYLELEVNRLKLRVDCLW